MGLGFLRKVHHSQGGMAAGSQVKKLRVHIFHHNQEAERDLEVGLGCELSEPSLVTYFLPNMATDWAQAFKYLSLRQTFLIQNATQSIHRRHLGGKRCPELSKGA